jgi:hypothetical protein
VWDGRRVNSVNFAGGSLPDIFAHAGFVGLGRLAHLYLGVRG